jgi:hypothetical protein
MNSAAVRLLGRTREAAAGRRLHELVPTLIPTAFRIRATRRR